MEDQPVAGFRIDRREIYLKDGRTMPITNFLDVDGDDLPNDPDKFEIEDLGFVVGGAGDEWFSVDVSHFVESKPH